MSTAIKRNLQAAEKALEKAKMRELEAYAEIGRAFFDAADGKGKFKRFKDAQVSALKAAMEGVTQSVEQPVQQQPYGTEHHHNQNAF